MSRQVHRRHVTDTLKVLSVQLQSENISGVMTNLNLTNSVSGAVKFKMVNKATGKTIIAITSTGVTFTADTNGYAQYDFSSTPTLKPGIFYGFFVFTDTAETDHYPFVPGDLVIEINSDTLTAQEAYQADVQAGVSTTVESEIISRFPETLTIGDSYTTDTGKIKLLITDGSNNPITGLGTLDFADATIVFTAFRPNDSATITGTCVFVDATTETYIYISIPASETTNGKAEYTYEGRLKFFWEGPSSGNSDDEQKTYKTTPFKFIANP